MMATIFSRIVQGEIPSIKIYEDDHTYAFMDIAPASRGHTLVICKAELANLYEIDEVSLIAVAKTTQRVANAIRDALNPDGLNIVQNNGAAAGQTVFHYHVHLIPRWDSDGAVGLWRPHSSDIEQLKTLAAEIQRAL
ncbi:MAG: HIT family protein [Chloroflexota bacterium]|jgi:histidine triad (HIT) family protein